jgi:hypothetical protein
LAPEQVRDFRIEGDKLHIEAAPQPDANFRGRVMRGILVWQREFRTRISPLVASYYGSGSN